MKKFGAALIIYLGLASAALAQQITPPVGAQGIACAYNTTAPSVAAGFFGYVQCDSAGRLVSIQNSAYPLSATPITAMVTGTTGAVSANLTAVVGKTTYICGYQLQSNATAATSIPNASITGTITGTMPFIEAVAAAPAVATTAQTFTPCIPASGTNTPIGINAGAAGAGGNTTIYAWGYQQ